MVIFIINMRVHILGENNFFKEKVISTCGLTLEVSCHLCLCSTKKSFRLQLKLKSHLTR